MVLPTFQLRFLILSLVFAATEGNVCNYLEMETAVSRGKRTHCLRCALEYFHAARSRAGNKGRRSTNQDSCSVSATAPGVPLSFVYTGNPRT